MKLDGKVCVVTGAATGMGRSLALSLASKGCPLALADVDVENLAETARLAESLGVFVTSHHVDVSSRAAVEAFRDSVRSEHGGCAVLFNNAGMSASGRLIFDDSVGEAARVDYQRGWDRCFNIDFYGVVYMSQAFLPMIIAQPEGYIVNTSSVNAFWTWPEHSAYTAAKHAVRGFTESLMVECMMKAPHVIVACVHPGGVSTQIAAKSIQDPGAPPGRHDEGAKKFGELADLSADDAVAWILGGMAKDSTRILVGYDALLMDVAVRLGPRMSYQVWAALGKAVVGVEKLREGVGPVVTLTGLVKFLWYGGWYFPLMMSPMILASARRSPLFKPALAAAAGVAALKLLKPRL